MGHVLTTDDVKALRRARDILFKADSNGHGKITAILEKQDCTDAEERIFHEEEQDPDFRYRRWRTIIPEDGRAPKIDGKDAFGHAHLMLCHYDDEWQTIAHFLKAGDEIHVHFHANIDQNNYLKTAVTETNAGRYEGINADVLRLVVYRDGKRLTFRVDNSICPDNSARMIQPYGSVIHATTHLTPEKVFGLEKV